MNAAGMHPASGVLLSSQSAPALHCGLCSSCLGPRELPASNSMSAAGFSGRTPTPVSRVRQRGGRGRRPASTFCDFVLILKAEASRSQSGCVKFNFVPVSGLSAPPEASNGGQASDRASNFTGDQALSCVEIRPFGLVSGGHSRTGSVVRVSTSPAAEIDSRRFYYASEGSVGEGEEEEGYLREELPPDLQPELMPRHVAIIMDGNARWARGRGMHLSLGHAAGAEALKQVAGAASKWGIDALTVFAFSTENWRRPQVEVNFLMHMFETKLQTEMTSLIRNNFRLRFIGNISALPLSLQKAIESAKEYTSVNTGMIINICVSYSGRADLVQACRQLAAQVAEGTLNPADIDDAAIANKVFMSELGELQDPDLVIRTSGEQRISNFLLWQVAYSEFVFSDILWPDFGKEDFRSALVTYQRRDRRHGIRHA